MRKGSPRPAPPRCAQLLPPLASGDGGQQAHCVRRPAPNVPCVAENLDCPHPTRSALARAQRGVVGQEIGLDPAVAHPPHDRDGLPPHIPLLARTDGTSEARKAGGEATRLHVGESGKRASPLRGLARTTWGLLSCRRAHLPKSGGQPISARDPTWVCSPSRTGVRKTTTSKSSRHTLDKTSSVTSSDKALLWTWCLQSGTAH